MTEIKINVRIKGKCRKCGISIVMPFKWWLRWKSSKKRNEKPLCLGCWENERN